MRIAMFSAAFVLVASPIAAQGSTAVGLRQPAITSSRTIQPRTDSVPQTYWVRGAEIGAGVGFLLGAFVQLVSSHLCESDPCGNIRPVLFLAPMGFFGFIGSMIGSGFRKGS